MPRRTLPAVWLTSPPSAYNEAVEDVEEDSVEDVEDVEDAEDVEDDDEIPP